ncbi:cyclic diguanylate phosphodiesterase [Aeromonas veronii]|uniref:EAL domain-containing protein n=1 Tax=Aeromonas veronii TaxID=654 RepID=UPI001F234B0B|nr:cyclic diguanylate phosphodiesterase [Aeromonas veronii]MCF5765380.1 cyclic diguanylate phosphodiesterase [Aeromonas veronii]
MPFRRLKLRQLYKRLLVSLLIGVGILLLGGAAIIWQTVSEIERDAESRLQRAMEMFDRTFNHARQAAINLEGVLGHPCREAAQRLREQVTTVPDVRSANLAIGRHIYCTSLYGDYDGLFNPDIYVEGRLQLLPGNEVTPDRPLIVLRHQTDKGSVLIVVDGYYLRNTLDISSKNSRIALVVGNTALFGSGQMGPAPSATEEGYLSYRSASFPYQVATQVTNHDYLIHAWRHSAGSIVLYPLLALLVGIGSFRLMGRSRSPSEELKRALIEEEFIPYLQPVVSGEDERWHGCEVLMRWQHPKQGMISPDRFIPLAEDSGLIVPMTSLLMTQVRDYFSPDARKLPAGFHFGFNICASHCKDLSLVTDCRAFINAFKDNPVKLVLELTERELIVTDETTDKLFAELRQLGVMIAIDDFGTGHSSLTYLQQFQVDALKIDQSFVGMIGSDALSSHIVENVIDLATRLGLKLVAEGVETQVQSDYLRTRHVDYLQGYLYGRPIPMKQFCKTLFG